MYRNVKSKKSSSFTSEKKNHSFKKIPINGRLPISVGFFPCGKTIDPFLFIPVLFAQCQFRFFLRALFPFSTLSFLFPYLWYTFLSPVFYFCTLISAFFCQFFYFFFPLLSLPPLLYFFSYFLFPPSYLVLCQSVS